MTFDQLLQLLTIFAPVFAAALTGGGIVAYFKYRESRPESFAKARKISATAEIDIAEAWRLYAEKVEKRFSELESKYDTALKQKDDEIRRLAAEVVQLKLEVEKYRAMEIKAEDARGTIHETVDKSIDRIKEPPK